MSLLSVAFYLALLLFLCATAARIARYAKMPPHLRWELYPAAAEKGTSEGSYLEQQEWWNTPRHRSRLAELRFQATEMFLFHRCYVNNRGLWRFTLPFHWGLYLLAGWLLIQFACGGADLFLGILGRTSHFRRWGRAACTSNRSRRSSSRRIWLHRSGPEAAHRPCLAVRHLT